MNEPIDTVFLSQVADGALHLGLINEEELEVTFKLNLLFFDHVAIGASGLLCNNLLYKYLIDENDSVAQMYKSTSSVGSILRPILWHENNDSIIDAANKMLNAKTIHYLPDNEDLIRHAEMISSFKPTYLGFSERQFRDDYRVCVENFVVSALRSDSNILKEVGLSKDDLSNFEVWLSKEKNDVLRCSDIYRFAEQNKSDSIEINFKKLADTLYQYTLASSQWAEFSSVQEVSPIVQLAHLNSSSYLINDIWKDRLTDKNYDEFSSELAIQLILSLPLSDVLLLRNLESFENFRYDLSAFRSGQGFSINKMQESLDYCIHHLKEYASGNRLQKQNMYKKIKNDERKVVFRFLYDGAALAASPMALIMYSPDPVPAVLTTITSASLFAANKYLSKGSGSKNTVFSKSELPDIIYKPTAGTIISSDRA